MTEPLAASAVPVDLTRLEERKRQTGADPDWLRHIARLGPNHPGIRYHAVLVDAAREIESGLAASRAVERVRAAIHLDDDQPILPPDVDPPRDWRTATYEDGWDDAIDHVWHLVRAAIGGAE